MSEKTPNESGGRDIGSRFREARKATGLTPAELGYKAGCTGSYISMLENNAATPSLRRAFILEKLTGFSVSEWREAFLEVA